MILHKHKQPIPQILNTQGKNPYSTPQTPTTMITLITSNSNFYKRKKKRNPLFPVNCSSIYSVILLSLLVNNRITNYFKYLRYYLIPSPLPSMIQFISIYSKAN